MAINFPHNPNPNDVHTEASLGRSWKWDGPTWKIYSSTTTGIAFGDLSVSQQAASGSGSLTYNNAGIFTYTPPVGGGSGATNFTGLGDTPSSLDAGKWLKVNTGGTALEWTDAPSGTNTTYSLEALLSTGIKLTGSDTTTDSVFFDTAGGISISRSVAPGPDGGGTIKFDTSNVTPTNITVADESTETACYPLFTTAATGNLEPKTGTNIKFNSASGQLEAGSFKKTGGSSTEFLKADGSIDSNTYSQSTHTHTHSHSYALNDLTNVDATTNLANGKILKYDIGSTSWVVADDNASGGGSSSFTGLSDTPSAHSNDKWLKSNGSALIWADAPVNLTIANNGNNRIVTGVTGNELHAEGNLTFDGSTLVVTGAATISTDLTVSGKILDKDGDSGTSGQILSSTGTQVNWIDAPAPGNSGITIQEEGTALSTAATTINFTGAKVTASGTGTTKTVNVATPTLAEVTTAGNSTTNNITVNDLNVDGNLTVSGTTTTIDTATLNIADNILTLNSNYSGSSPTANAGIEVERGTAANVALRWNETSDKWQFTNDGSNYSDIGSGSASGTTNLGVTANGTSLTVTSDTGNNASIPAATTSAWGAMTDEMYDKLDGIASSANNYSHPNHTGDVTSTGDGATLIANNAVTLAKIENIATSRIMGRVASGTGDPETLTATQVRTLLNVADGAEVNVQSDWNQTTNTADDFIKNKPTGILTSVPTLTQVTTAGNTTSNNIEVGNCTVTGDLLVDGLVGISDTKITLNSDHSGSAPTADCDLVVERGNSTDVRIRWDESEDKWTATNDGSTYFNLSGFSGDYNDLTNRPADNNNYANSLSWNSSNGVLTVGRSGLGNLTVDLDGRYATSVPTNNNQLTNGAGYITSSGTAANANNVKIRTDNDAAWHYLLFVDSSTDNQNQTLKLDSSGAKYYPSLNWLQTATLQSAYMADWNGGAGNAGDVLTSQGSNNQWQWVAAAAGFLGKTKITIKTSGSGNHTTESWCKTVWAIIQGGGGAGGSARSGTAQGGRGGHGGMQVNYQNDLTAATSIPYSVGGGGARHGGGGNCDDAIQSGGNGGSSYFGPTNNRGTAAGGTGGAGAYDGQIGANGTDGGMRFFASDYGAGGQGGTWTGGDGCNNTSEAGQGGAIFILELG